MSDERRSSVRRRAKLPFAWRESSTDATTHDICQALDLPPVLALQPRLADLDETFLTATANLTDPRMADALRALDGKLAVLEEALLAQARAPSAADVEISADGIGFRTRNPVATGARIGVHVVLPVRYHVVAAARVTHCVGPAGSGGLYRVGAEFVALDGNVGRRLTRFAISRDSVSAS